MGINDYLSFINANFIGEAKTLLLKQVENFFNISNLKLNNAKYKVGESVNLKKDYFLHGVVEDYSKVEKFALQGLISQDFVEEKRNIKINYCVSLFHIKKQKTLKDYIVEYSGMSVTHNGKFFLVPYKGLDAFVEKVRSQKFWDWQARSSMEQNFLPSLSRDINQVGFIINGSCKNCKPLIFNNLLNESINFETISSFMNFKSESQKQTFKNNRQIDDCARIAYVMFGIPKNMIEGVLVGRKFEHNKQQLLKIKTLFPDCYICNLDGKVIVE